MYMFDNKISLDNREIIEEYLNGYEYRTSGLSFSGQYMWRDINRFCFDMIGEYMCISGVSHLELDEGTILPFMFPPLTKTGKYDKDALSETIYKSKEIFEKAGQPFSLRLVPEHMVDLIKEACPKMNFIDDRPNYDYIYLTQALVDLKGKSYHGKKNHLNYFKKTYDYEYVSIGSDMTDDVMRFLREENRKKEIPENEMELLRMEEEAIEDVFRNIEAVGYKAGAIKIDDKIQSVVVGGKLGSETMVEHIEKANTEFRGLYQAINNEFCRSVVSEATYINREEDMGIENLRKSKLSYKPIELLPKYIGVFE